MKIQIGCNFFISYRLLPIHSKRVPNFSELFILKYLFEYSSKKKTKSILFTNTVITLYRK